MPAAWDQRSYVLRVAQQVWRNGCKRSQTPEAAGGRELEAEAHRRRSGIGYHDVEGSGRKKMVSPKDKRAAVAHVRQAHGASERRACGLVGQPRSTQRYEAKAEAGGYLAHSALRSWQPSVRALAIGV